MSFKGFAEKVDPSEIQGNILRGYNFSHVRHLVLRITDGKAARRWLGATLSRDEAGPVITTEESWPDGEKPESCFNIGLTYTGLRALGVSQRSLDSFPEHFVDGMPARAEKLGDIGDSAPEKWAKPFSDPDRVHLIATIHANGIGPLNRIQEQVEAAGNGKAFALETHRNGQKFDGDAHREYVHFGYRDGISQPRVDNRGAPQDERPLPNPDQLRDKQPLTPIGAVLMGHKTEYEGLFWKSPHPRELGKNGCFNAFRILAQDVFRFEKYLDRAADQILAYADDDDSKHLFNEFRTLHDEYLLPIENSPFEDESSKAKNRRTAFREIVRAKMCGRWPNGAPLAVSPSKPREEGEAEVSFTSFNYDDDNPAYEVSFTSRHDINDVRCPYGAHMRRSNPRSGKIVQRSARHTRRLIRRGMPYGPLAFDRDNPDEVERGLLGNFIGANLGAHFEAVMCDWVNLGLQDPRITGTNDPLVGLNDPKISWFDIPLKSNRKIRLTGLPRFVETRGGAYTFLPSIDAIRYLASL